MFYYLKLKIFLHNVYQKQLKIFFFKLLEVEFSNKQYQKKNSKINQKRFKRIPFV